MNVLVVEDNASTREMLETLLRQAGFGTDHASNGLDGLARLTAAGPFDAVILDVIMPGLDGFEFLRRVRQNPEWKDVPVIVQSAADAHTLERLGDPALRPLAVLQKPWEVPDLLMRLDALRGREGAEGGGA